MCSSLHVVVLVSMVQLSVLFGCEGYRQQVESFSFLIDCIYLLTVLLPISKLLMLFSGGLGRF